MRCNEPAKHTKTEKKIPPGISLLMETKIWNAPMSKTKQYIHIELIEKYKRASFPFAFKYLYIIYIRDAFYLLRKIKLYFEQIIFISSRLFSMPINKFSMAYILFVSGGFCVRPIDTEANSDIQIFEIQM